VRLIIVYSFVVSHVKKETPKVTNKQHISVQPLKIKRSPLNTTSLEMSCATEHFI